MAKYLILWKTKPNSMPTDPKEAATQMKNVMDMTKRMLKDHPGWDYGMFLGEEEGYILGEMSPEEIQTGGMMFGSFVSSKVYQILSLDEVEKISKSVMAKT